MTGGPEPTMEDRLRSHYRHLREVQPVDDQPLGRDPSRVLAVAAGLTILLVLGGAYLAGRATPSGDPVRADVGAGGQELLGEGVEGDRDGPIDDDRLRTDDDRERPGPEPTSPAPGSEPSQPEGDTDGSNEVGPGSGAEGDADGFNADGSPIAPKPGTVLPPPDADQAMAYGTWEPGRHDTCSAEIHDRYWVYGPDGKVYPTYHPPIDPVTGCSFGHEHGRDPAGSDLADIPFPFGYVNEQLVAAGSPPRPESHVGHKIEWYDDGGYYEAGSSVERHDQVCDVAYKVHLDTHSAASFENDTNEVFLYARCGNGSALIYRAMHRFGNRGEFHLHCDQRAGPTVTVGADDRAGGGAGDRVDGREVPARSCFEDRVLVPEGQRSDWFPFDERWTLYQSVDSGAFGRFFIQLQFFVDLPARYWDGEGLANTIDLCYLTGERQVRGDDLCAPLREANPGVEVPWDDPASPFDGSARSIFMGDLRLDNEAGQTDWYTDAHGDVWSDQPFPGAIRQYVATTPIRAAASYRPDPIRSISFADDLGIHPPN